MRVGLTARGGLWWRAWEWARVRGHAEGGCTWAQAAWRARPRGGAGLTEWPAAQDRGEREEKRGRGTRVGFFLFLLFLF
jgi:hypothetical protein